MGRCVTCGCKLPPLNGCEENDFAVECEYCQEFEDIEEEGEDEDL